MKGRPIAIDATTLQAHTAIRSSVPRHAGERYQAFLARLDRQRKRKTSNADCTSSAEPDAKVPEMKEGLTPLGSKAEPAVDLETGPSSR